MSDEATVFQPAPQGSLRPGVRLNGMFEIERLIAEGGMGEVYKGLAVASGDAVAIKLVRPDLARDPEVMALFKREAQVLHDLLHDAIVRYYVFSLEPDLQRYYIAMEFVDGLSLQKRLASGPLSPADARVLLRRIGGALEQAHGRGVVHRDISSDNIILPDGDVRRAKIVDFGIAKAARPGEGTIIGGGLAGKYKYMSPEQLGLYGGEVTPKSDIYSFGLVLAEALRGKPIDMGGSQAEVVEKRRVVPDLAGVDPALQPLLRAMLAPDPARRPQTMAEVAAWGESATTRPDEPKPKPIQARRGSGALVAAVAAVVVLAGLGGAAYLWSGGGAAPPTPVPTQPKLPTIPPAEPSSSPQTADVAATPAPEPTRTPEPGPTKIVTADDLIADMPPKPSQNETTLAPATAGAPYRAELPVFGDPGGKGLTLRATPPPGLVFADLGGGRSEISGAPTAAGDQSFEVVAVNHAGKSARMKVALSVAAAPPPPSPEPSSKPPPPKPQPPKPPQAEIALEPAAAGSPYSAGLPPFRAEGEIKLKAGPGLPDGLTLDDLGNGLAQLAGAPKTPGLYAFDVVAMGVGGEARMKVRVEVRAPPATAESFVRDYPSPPCFTADVDAGGAVTVTAADEAAVVGFEAALRKAVAGARTQRLIVRASQCAAVDLLRAARGGPQIRLDAAEVSAARPVSGQIAGLAGRSLLVLVVDDDGACWPLRAQIAADGGSAHFSRSFGVNDAATFGKPQLVLAIAADKPLDGVKVEGASAAAALPKLAAEATLGAAAARFTFVK